MLTVAEKITEGHRERRAYIYVRQSTPQQVHHHRESQQNQYGLVQRAVDLGWIPERIHVIDADQGQSGQDSTRVGFRELVAEVSLGRVGLICAYEASRLARSNAEWYSLLDLAAVVGTLIADPDGVYDPRSYNDRLLLGLRGILSEAELHVLQLRLTAGRLRQIERGSYRQHLPTGYLRLDDGRVVKDPDLQIQRTLGLVFDRFATLHSAQQVLRSLRADGLLLPRRQVAGAQAGELLWKQPTYAAIYAIIRNPAYAGAFVYGRRGRCSGQAPGQHARTGWRAREAWSAIHQEVYPAYVSWEQYLANQDILADNASRFARRARGAVRNGGALLAGLVVCGRCGRQMRVLYRSTQRYVCTAMSMEYRVPSCLSLDGAAIDQAVVEAFFAALAPAELDLLDEVLERQRQEHERLGQQYADQVSRSEYEVRLAERRYRAADPDNRLVAAELERQWELALRARAEAHEAAQRFRQATATPPLDPELRAQLRDVGTLLPRLWQSGRLTAVQQKALLRSLIRRIILTRPQPDTVEVKVIWVSGAISLLRVEPRLHRAVDRGDYARLVERILALSGAGYQDPAIARQLTAEGFRSARSQEVPVELVYKVRHAHGQPARTEQFRRQAKIEGCWTVGGLAQEMQVTSNWLRKQIRLGRVPATRDPTTGRYLIADGAEVLEALKTCIAAR
jgi:DNA invertase Pin-like site-specific DNA recombinase